MSNLQLIHPSDIFRKAVRNIRTELDIISISNSGGLYEIELESLDKNKISIGCNITLYECDELSGDYKVKKISGNKIYIENVSGLDYELGKLLAYPYYRSGNSSMLISEQSYISEFPFIHYLEPDNLNYPIKDSEIAMYDDSFTFIIMDRNNVTKDNTSDSEYELIKKNILNDLLNIVNEFVISLDLLVDKVSNISITEYPIEGTGTQSGKLQGSTYNYKIAGYKVSLNLLIPKRYELQQCL